MGALAFSACSSSSGGGNGTGGGSSGTGGSVVTGGTGGGVTGGTGGVNTGGTGNVGTGGGNTGGTGGGSSGGTCKKFCCAASDCPSGMDCAAIDPQSGTLGVCLPGSGAGGSGGGSAGAASGGAAGAGGGTPGDGGVTLPAGCWNGTVECNPVTNGSCNGSAGEACDLESAGGLQCFPDGNTQPLGGACDNANGPWCQGGMHCTPTQ